MKEQAKREAENLELDDLPRLKALAEREQNLKIVRDSDQVKAVGLTQEQQVARIAKDQNLALPGDESATSATGKVPAKPDGPVNPETQQPGARLGVPKGKAVAKSASKK